jgi:hypothetical protein
VTPVAALPRRARQNGVVDRRDREAILGEWGVRDATGREQAEAALLDRDLDGSPLRGKPLQGRLRNFRPAVDRYVVSLGGPLPYMRRLRQIELETEQHECRLAEAWRDLAASCAGDAGAFDRRWRALATRWSFDAVNTLVDRHNRWYPAEARLPMDPRTGDFVPVGGKPYRREPLDASWILERFPPELALARAA